eukprot:7040747-Pyramimonas_sp.AAC.1
MRVRSPRRAPSSRRRSARRRAARRPPFPPRGKAAGTSATPLASATSAASALHISAAGRGDA